MTTFTGHLTDAQAQRLLDGVLFPGEAAEVEAHAASCGDCAALVASYRLLSSRLDDLAIPDLPDDFTAGVLSAVDAREQTVARERWLAAGILSCVVAVAAAAFALAGAAAWAPALSGAVDGLGAAARTLRITAGFVPALVGALRVQIILAAAAFALPLLVALARLIPAPRTEAA